MRIKKAFAMARRGYSSPSFVRWIRKKRNMRRLLRYAQRKRYY